MPEISLHQVDARRQRQFEKARQAHSRGDHAYTINVTRALLRDEPGCLEVRQLLRSAQEAASRGRAGRLRGLLGSLSGLTGGRIAKKDPARGLIEAEEELSKDPRSISGHRLLGDCARALDLPATAAFAYQHWCQLEPKKREAHLAWGEALIATGRAAEAVETAEAALRRFPGDSDVQALLKEASVALSLSQGRWEESGDYRAKLANAAERLESSHEESR